MTTSSRRPPLIVTLRFDARTFALLDAMRTKHFPAHLNLVPAHLTLFHHLPGDRTGEVIATAERLAADTAPFSVLLDGVLDLGAGVAIEATSVILSELRQRFAAEWHDDLTAQDKQRFRPHVTIQNKVARSTAAELRTQLARDWKPVPAVAEGLLIWRYLAGPWTLECDVSFEGCRHANDV